MQFLKLAAIVALALSFAQSASASTIGLPGNYLTLSSGLVGYWTFDGKTTNWATGQTLDLSGNGYSGNLASSMGASATPKGGKIGQAFYFNGVDQDVITLGSSPVSDGKLTTTASVSAWIKPDTLSGEHVVFSSGTGAGPYWWVEQTNSALRWIGVAGALSNILDSASVLSANQWQYVVFVGTPSSLKIYLNGAIVAQSNDSIITSGTNVVNRIGSTQSRYFSGAMDDVRVYNRALSDSEVMQLYHLGAANVAHSNTVALSSGLVGYWNFDGGATHWNTGKVDDISGQNNTGQLINMSTTTSPTPGKIGQALKFNGSSSYVSVPDSTSLSLTSTFSFTAWVKPSVTGTRVIMTRNSSPNQDDIQFDGSGNLYYRQYPAGGNGFAFSTAAAVPTGVWTHVSITYNASSNVMSFYINGAFVESHSPSATLLIEHNLINVGADKGQQDFLPFSGLMDDVRIYNRALSPTEVQALYNIGVANVAHSNTTALSSGLVGYWTFDGGATHWNTGKVDDVSGHGNTGQLINMSTTTSPVPGKIGQALKFVRSNSQYINLNNPSALDLTTGTSPITVSAWIKTDSVIVNSILGIVKRGAQYSSLQTDQYDLETSAAGLVFAMGNGSVAAHPQSGNVLVPNTWYFVTGVADATTVYLYVNGALASTSPRASGSPPASAVTYIGSVNSNQFYFLGSIDDVRIYNRALSASEVQALYSMGR
jgi:hypothetical protein